MRSSFRIWRDRMGWTQDEAAENLGLSKSQVANFDAGVSRTSGEAAIPSLATRKLMTAYARGIELEPWPSDGEPMSIILTPDERQLMRELAERGGRASISGNKSRRGMQRLVDEGYVTSFSPNLSTVEYSLAEAGARALLECEAAGDESRAIDRALHIFDPATFPPAWGGPEWFKAMIVKPPNRSAVWFKTENGAPFKGDVDNRGSWGPAEGASWPTKPVEYWALRDPSKSGS